MSKISVSVIIPVYNAAPWLHRCLDSVCGQTLKDIEILCVNDASTDNSLEILNEYAVKDDRIKIFNNEKNLGETASRNAAMTEAQGEYLGFVDSDDAVELDFFRELYTEAKRTGADIVKGETKVIDDNGDEKIKLLNDNIRSDKLFFSHCFFSAIYKNQFIVENKFCFPQGITNGGDIVFLTKTVLKATKIITRDDVFYLYYRREDSMDSKILSNAKILSVLTVYGMVFDEINMAYDKAEIDGDVYIDIYILKLNFLCSISCRNDEYESKYACAKGMIKFYNECRNQNVLRRLNAEYPAFCECLVSGDEASLAGFLAQNNSVQKLFLANVRKKITA